MPQDNEAFSMEFYKEATEEYRKELHRIVDNAYLGVQLMGLNNNKTKERDNE